MNKVFLIGAAFFSLTAIGMACRHQLPKRFTEHDVLWQLDSAFSADHKIVDEQEAYKMMRENNSSRALHYTFFLDLEHGYCITAGSKIHLYADSTRWAIVFEKSGYENRAEAAQLELDYFGNCIKPNVKQVGGYTQYSNVNFIDLISSTELEHIRNKTGAEMETFEKISPDAKTVSINGRIVPIEHALSKYLKLGIIPDTVENPHRLIGFGDLVRYYSDTEPKLVSAEESDIRKYLPADLPKIMSISKFHFESFYNPKNLFSGQETYQLIAKILVKRDSTLWRPKEKANNHWSNWTSGNL